jgi:hypothetical protein
LSQQLPWIPSLSLIPLLLLFLSSKSDVSPQVLWALVINEATFWKGCLFCFILVRVNNRGTPCEVVLIPSHVSHSFPPETIVMMYSCKRALEFAPAGTLARKVNDASSRYGKLCVWGSFVSTLRVDQAMLAAVQPICLSGIDCSRLAPLVEASLLLQSDRDLSPPMWHSRRAII